MFSKEAELFKDSTSLPAMPGYIQLVHVQLREIHGQTKEERQEPTADSEEYEHS
jgi:hypothetical protein